MDKWTEIFEVIEKAPLDSRIRRRTLLFLKLAKEKYSQEICDEIISSIKKELEEIRKGLN